ncbi:MAG: flagellar basal body rod protein FlgB [Chloroflexota bacterium]|nr:flagellar basal body rod protein FlgB [Dehalococcoidia bacterium]MDW8255328.1 flagellar basal body rod protein FlgB [Chloroflexota bacterium]
MSLRPFESTTLRGLTAALRGLSQRHQAIATNIANVDTPWYQATEVSFERALQQALGRGDDIPLATTHAAHLGAPAALEAVVTRAPAPSTARRNDGNTVDLDREMTRLAETSLRYNVVASLISSKYAGLRTAINEGRR